MLIVVRPLLAYRQWEADGKIEARAACDLGDAQCIHAHRMQCVMLRAIPGTDGKRPGAGRAYPAIVSTRDLFGFTIPTRRRFQNLTWRRPRSTSVSILDTFCRHRLEPKSPAGRCRIVRRGTTFLVARSCSVRLSPHHIHSLARRSIHHRSADDRNTGREHHNSHHHNSIALRRCPQSLKETSPRTGTMQVSSWSPPTCGT